MKIIRDVDMNLDDFRGRDKALLTFISSIPHYIRTFQIIEMENHAEEQLVEYMSRSGVGEYNDDRQFICNVGHCDNTNRVVLFVVLWNGSQYFEQICDYLESFQWEALFPTIEYSEIRSNFKGDAKEVSDKYLEEFEEFDTPTSEEPQYAQHLTPSEYREPILARMDDIDVDFLRG